MKKHLVIMGAGGFAREVYSWVQDEYEVKAFYSDSDTPPILGLPVVSDLSLYTDSLFMVAVGSPVDRLALWDIAIKAGLSVASGFVHKSATMGVGCHIGKGVIICPQSVITTNVTIGEATIVNIGSTIGHDCVIGELVTIAPGANISGHCKILNRSYIGTNASIREGLFIGPESVVGMGSVVISNVPNRETWAGVPAQRIK